MTSLSWSRCAGLIIGGPSRGPSDVVPLAEVATTLEGSGVVMISEEPGHSAQSAEIPPGSLPGGQGVDGFLCFWRRRGRVESYPEHGDPVLIAA